MNKEPLYSTIASTVEEWIRSGEWSAGMRLPPERALCERLGVSRVTLRQALAELERRNLVSRHQGRGTFVAPPRVVDADTSAFFTLGAAIRARGLRLVTRVLAVEQVEASRQLAQELGHLPGEPLLRLDRLRLVEDEPLVLETAHLPLRRFPGLERGDFERRSLYDVLREDYATAPTDATETLEPVILTAKESALMRVPPHTPALLVHRSTTDRDGVPLETSEALLRGDRSRFLLHRRVPLPEQTLVTYDHVGGVR